MDKPVKALFLAGVPRALKLSVKRKQKCYHCYSNKSTVAEWLIEHSRSGKAKPAGGGEPGRFLGGEV